MTVFVAPSPVVAVGDVVALSGLPKHKKPTPVSSSLLETVRALDGSKADRFSIAHTALSSAYGLACFSGNKTQLLEMVGLSMVIKTDLEEEPIVENTAICTAYRKGSLVSIIGGKTIGTTKCTIGKCHFVITVTAKTVRADIATNQERHFDVLPHNKICEKAMRQAVQIVGVLGKHKSTVDMPTDAFVELTVIAALDIFASIACKEAPKKVLKAKESKAAALDNVLALATMQPGSAGIPTPTKTTVTATPINPVQACVTMLNAGMMSDNDAQALYDAIITNAQFIRAPRIPNNTDMPALLRHQAG